MMLFLFFYIWQVDYYRFAYLGNIFIIIVNERLSWMTVCVCVSQLKTADRYLRTSVIHVGTVSN